jgi:hypothetical protein
LFSGEFGRVVVVELTPKAAKSRRCSSPTGRQLLGLDAHQLRLISIGVPWVVVGADVDDVLAAAAHEAPRRSR